MFNALEAAELVDERQRTLIAELRRLLPITERTPTRPRPL